MNFLPQRLRWPSEPLLGVSLASLRQPSWEDRAAWAQAEGFDAVELSATGEPWSLHAPLVSADEREYLRDKLRDFRGVSVAAPHQATFDVTLVSPSSAIRRASISEIWSVCRFVGALGGGIVLIRTGTSPFGISEEHQREFISESLVTLDRMAGDHNALIGLSDFDYFTHWENFAGLRALNLRHTGFVLDLDHLAAAGGPAALKQFLQQNAGQTLQVRVPVTAAAGADEAGGDSMDLLASLVSGGAFGGIICLTTEPTGGAEKALLAARDRWRRLTVRPDESAADA